MSDFRAELLSHCRLISCSVLCMSVDRVVWRKVASKHACVSAAATNTSSGKKHMMCYKCRDRYFAKDVCRGFIQKGQQSL